MAAQEGRTLTIAVAGAGFGGAYLVKELERLRYRAKQPLRVLLFEPRQGFVFTPLLHEVAAAGLELEHVVIPYERIFDESWVELRHERVIRVDTSQQRLFTETGSYPYDYLVLATGSQTNYYGNSQAQAQSLTLKDEADALAIRAFIREALHKAAAAPPKEQRRLLSVAVVGGGPTGVELVADIMQLLRYRLRRDYPSIAPDAPSVTLYQGAKVLLPTASPRIQREAHRVLGKLGIRVETGARVTAVLKNGVVYTDKDDRTLSAAANLVIWVAGVTPTAVPLDGSGQGAYLVNGDLSIKGHESLFALGDAAKLDPGLNLPPLPALAQAAVQEAKAAARNVVHRVNGERTEQFRFRPAGFLLSLGQKNAAGEVRTPLGTLFIRGFFAWWLWRTVYLFKFLDVRHQRRTAWAWTKRLFVPRSPPLRRMRKKF
jgi:NADH dehydrogenase